MFNNIYQVVKNKLRGEFDVDSIKDQQDGKKESKRSPKTTKQQSPKPDHTVVEIDDGAAGTQNDTTPTKGNATTTKVNQNQRQILRPTKFFSSDSKSKSKSVSEGNR
jgi:hypothetical protein